MYISFFFCPRTARRVRKMENAGKCSSSWLLFLVSLFPLGCDNTLPSAVEITAPPAELGAHFDASATGTVQGRVLWEGDLPAVAPFTTRPHPLASLGLRDRLVRDNPNAPH